MALNFDKIMSDSENLSLEDLSIESLVQTDLDTSCITFHDLFEDHLSLYRREHNNVKESLPDNFLFDLDVEDADIENWDFNLIDSFQFDDLNLEQFEINKSTVDYDEIFAAENTTVNDTESSNISKKKATVIRRQSTRIQDQTRKTIAEQIQRENVRLAKEAQLLNNKDDPVKQTDISNDITNDKPLSPATLRYMAMPTDLDAADYEEVTFAVQLTSNEELFCLCRQPRGDRFMIGCNNCLALFHGDCVGVSTTDDSTDVFICQSCITKTVTEDVTLSKSAEIVIIDDENEDSQQLNCTDDDDCLIVKAEEPITFNSNIFQLIEKDQHFETEKSQDELAKIDLLLLSNRTAGCLSQGCAILVDPNESLYCSEICMDKYTKAVIENNLREKTKEYGLVKGQKLAKITRFVLAQPATDTIQDEFEAPTEENLKEFLLKNPTYKVYQSSKPIKSKPDKEKSKKLIESLNNDPSRHIKIVKHFATLFKKSMTQKTFNAEFRNVWHHCLKMEEELFRNCGKSINDTYILKVKQMSEFFKINENNKLCFHILYDKLSVSDLFTMDLEQLDERLRVISAMEEELPTVTIDKSIIVKRKSVINKGGISLLSDTTHLHGLHLYDIKCKVCNGTSKPNEDNQEKESIQSIDIPISLVTKLKSPEKLSSPTNDVSMSSFAETPDLVIDQPTICLKPSEKDESKSNTKNDIVTNHTLSTDVTNVTAPINSLKSQKRKLLSLWEGKLKYNEVGSVHCKSYLVTRFFLDKHGSKDQESILDSDEEICDQIDVGASIGSEIIINGRSQLSVVEEYLRNLRRRSKLEFVVLRLHPSNMDQGRGIYLSMFQYFHSRERCGVISQKRIGVKECFLYPLNAHAKIPKIFLPFVGPGLEKRRPHLLLLLIVRNPLIKMDYQPISPRYDQDHDFAKMHGINLDKYHCPNPNPPFCPSPISHSDGNVTSVVNLRSSVANDNNDDCENEDFKDFNQDCGVIDEDNVPSTPIIETRQTQTNVNCQQVDTNAIHNSPPIITHDKDNNISTASILQTVANIVSLTSSKSTSSLIQKVADIVLNSPIATISAAPIPDKLPTNILENADTIQSAFLQKMTNIVLHSSRQEITKSVSDPIDVPQYYSTAPDLSLRPQAFVYRSLVKKCNRAQTDPCLIPPLDQELKSIVSKEDFEPAFERDQIVTTKWDNYPKRTFDCSAEEYLYPDVDMRFNLGGNVESTTLQEDEGEDEDEEEEDEEEEGKEEEEIAEKEEEEVFLVRPQNLYLKRKSSNRVYTYYDSFDNEEHSKEKRLKYFFNPYCQREEYHFPPVLRCRPSQSMNVGGYNGDRGNIAWFSHVWGPSRR